ncbi:MAG: 30S ribosomal protein S20 [Candidatus Ryanbacteria bacterium RIFCSPHIGHO2_02_FULL_48_12]|uniref:Small ribosomal subunit protein bS20 n=1 Tax=Candidatus Ryanbacteria bacterium RIFCSPHIGHO2_01_FULL_48_27 TaxID=1802115 RepID=A0A1G2G876_9BACT|nr:MAG: 30S ribosomal protein S20 [Candidatus Ryanbacteria bacterium RIFCSPHIGHO2_01_FULL_48_27]OGZ49167.1 MAG: 30S ribosomal protein S20 [Candidatus Ryanbacteria bacterium RIFCSPHIGHO2_02_FULL_48_12]
MPISRSAKKALRQSKRRKVLNLKRKDTIRDIAKKIKRLAAEGKHEEAVKLLPEAYKALDKAAKKDTIKKNTASRKKSRIAKLASPQKKG